ncbi:MAG: ribonuclease III [Actinomycetes bacterium]|nr:MAG: ribonuclease III [Actinomycetota bacterium]
MSIEARLGHTFADRDLLLLALTHRSVSADDPGRADNERLEFLGDAVLQLVITERLYQDYPQFPEGQMAKIRAALVSRPTLAEIARTIDLGAYLELSPSEERSGGRGKDSILANAMEAVIGAVYLDAGLEVAGRMILDLWGGRIEDRARQPGIKDYKTRLQEVLAQAGKRPAYEVTGSGPDHDRWFVAEVVIDGEVMGRGEGRSKKEAEQGAAEEALRRLAQS